MNNASQSDAHDTRDGALLVALIRAGDISGFEELYVRHKPAVTRTVAAIVRDRDEAPDVVHEAFTRALGHLDSLRDPDRFAPWLLSIARHVATDHIRDRLRVDLAAEAAELDAPEATPGPEELAELADLSRLVGEG